LGDTAVVIDEALSTFELEGVAKRFLCKAIIVVAALHTGI
jgi:hypothetical protein